MRDNNFCFAGDENYVMLVIRKQQIVYFHVSLSLSLLAYRQLRKQFYNFSLALRLPSNLFHINLFFFPLCVCVCVFANTVCAPSLTAVGFFAPFNRKKTAGS